MLVQDQKTAKLVQVWYKDSKVGRMKIYYPFIVIQAGRRLDLSA